MGEIFDPLKKILGDSYHTIRPTGNFSIKIYSLHNKVSNFNTKHSTKIGHNIIDTQYLEYLLYRTGGNGYRLDRGRVS